LLSAGILENVGGVLVDWSIESGEHSTRNQQLSTPVYRASNDARYTRRQGGAPVSRAGFGVSPKQSFGKVREPGTASPARETRALPGTNSCRPISRLEKGFVCDTSFFA
jgi:hypothetical protein